MLEKLQVLNIGYNDLTRLPEGLDQLKGLRILKVMNNFLEVIPGRICEMALRAIDVSSNPILQPPVETCERGLRAMKRYYRVQRTDEEKSSYGNARSAKKKNKVVQWMTLRVKVVLRER